MLKNPISQLFGSTACMNTQSNLIGYLIEVEQCLLVMYLSVMLL